MNLSEILSVECVKSPMDSGEKEPAIHELVDLLSDTGRISDADTLKDAVLSREQIRTTGIGHGLAIPHGKCSGMRELSMAVGKPAEPMDFDSIDGNPVRLIVLLASPADKTEQHIKALAQVSRMINNADFREKIYAASDPQEIYDLMVNS
jgi:fructose-specific phosphotransferase system IIA component